MLEDEASAPEPSPVRSDAAVELAARKESHRDDREANKQDRREVLRGDWDEEEEEDDDDDDDDDETAATRKKKPSNEYVLAVAFASFLAFVVVQVAFALIANSRSMLADAEAMMVDAGTYLFNLFAERGKRRSRERGRRRQPPPKSRRRCEACLAEARGAAGDAPSRPTRAREPHEEEEDGSTQNLCLELVPPAVSVLALVVVTSTALRSAAATLHSAPDEPAARPVNLTIMLAFSAANLLIDVVNVFCFSRIKKNLFGLENLNVCSAWTHVVADTMRSVAVLLAAGVATAFPTIPPAKADAVAAVVVSAIILVTVIRLVQGLILAALKAIRSRQDSPPSPPPCAKCGRSVEPVDV